MAGRIEPLLPVGPRPRQLSVRTLLIGMLACQADGRPAHISRVHQALVGLPETERERLGVTAAWKNGPHALTYRQTEYTFGRTAAVLSKNTPDGAPSDLLAGVVDDLIETSIPDTYKTASSSLAVDWTDLESWAIGPHSDGATADVEASWGRRRSHALGETNEVFYGYYFSAATTVTDEGGPAVPELIRRITLTTCRLDPVPAMIPVLARLNASGVTLGDVIADSGYAHRVAPHWALPLRAMGANIVTDLHPHDRGPHGTYAGATLANANLYCPATPPALLELAPPARATNPEQIAAHDTLTAEAAPYKLSPIGADDPDGYHRVGCPAIANKLRCPHRPDSMTLPYHQPTVTSPPLHPPACCTQKTLTVPPSVNAKTRQKHDYPGPAWRRSYNRRTGIERAYSTLKDPATNNIDRGWCRLMGLGALMLFLATTTTVRNLRMIDAFEARANQTRATTTTARRRRRNNPADLANAPP